MSQDVIPFIKWGGFQSTDAKNPDILDMKVLETETFETEYSTNVLVLYKQNNHDWIEAILPLKSHESNNSILLKEWSKCNLKANKPFKLKTWLGISKKSRRPLRRFILEF